MSRYEEVKTQLKSEPKIWLVTGVAGFIGSNLLETLLKLNQTVVGLDNFSTGFQHNLDEVQSLVTAEQWANFEFVEGDICDLETCRSVMRTDKGQKVNYVLHQCFGIGAAIDQRSHYEQQKQYRRLFEYVSRCERRRSR